MYTTQLELWDLDDEQWHKIMPRQYERRPQPKDTRAGQLALLVVKGAETSAQTARGRPRIYCSGRRQGRACSARSAALARYEQQIGAHLSTFTIPADYREHLRAFVAANGQAASDISGQRWRGHHES